METIHYDDIRKKVDYRVYLLGGQSLKKKLIPELLKQYPKDLQTEEEIFWMENSLDRQLPAILWATQGRLSNKRVLDLGSGGTKRDNIYKPWLARSLNIMGIYVAAVDQDLVDSDFRHGGIDLTKYNLNYIGKHQFDVANAKGLFDIANAYGLFDSRKMQKLSSQKLQGFKSTIEGQLGAILKPDGKFIYDGLFV